MEHYKLFVLRLLKQQKGRSCETYHVLLLYVSCTDYIWLHRRLESYVHAGSIVDRKPASRPMLRKRVFAQIMTR